MRIHFTEGIVLKKEPHGEADALFTFLTNDFGKIRCVAKGVRKQEAKLKGHMEVFSHVAIGFVIGKNMYRLTSADMKMFFPQIRLHPPALHGAATLVDMLDRNIFEERDDPRLFDLASATLLELEAGAGGALSDGTAPRGDGIEGTLLRFQAELLSVLGLLPEGGAQAALVRSLVREHLGCTWAPFSDILRVV